MRLQDDSLRLPEDILYLVHIANNNSRTYTEIRADGPGTRGQYPGAYFSLITKDNRLTERLFPGPICLIFSRNLLKQYNYHINVTDNNGFISEGNTYFPWNLDSAVKKIKENALLPEDPDEINYHRMNEVVFHDSVPMKYLCQFMQKGSKGFLPDEPIQNDVEPNMSLLPFYCHVQPEEENRLTSSYSFFQEIADICGVDRRLSKDEIIRKIEAKMDYLQVNRDEQRIELLPLLPERKGGKRRSRTIRSRRKTISRRKKHGKNRSKRFTRR